MNTLVAYYSRTGTNRIIAEELAGELNADLDEIVDHKNRKGVFGWLSAGASASRRKQTDISYKLDPGEYDLVIFGSPIWAGKLNPALRTYLVKNNLEGKKVAFFFVSDGNDPSGAIEELRNIIPWADFGSTLSLGSEKIKEGGYEGKVGKFAETLRRMQSDTD